jgi:hypothetical protein
MKSLRKVLTTTLKKNYSLKELEKLQEEMNNPESLQLLAGAIRSAIQSKRAAIQRRPKDVDEDEDPALAMAELLAGDESDGVFWGIAHEHGYFG